VAAGDSLRGLDDALLVKFPGEAYGSTAAT